MDDKSVFGLPDDSREPDPTEGVRIIGADEAAEAIERGDVAQRRPADAPKFGDRPSTPDGPRPSLRFPLSDVARSDANVRNEGRSPMPHWTEPATGEVPRIFAEEPESEAAPAAEEEDLDVWTSFSTQGPRWRDQSTDWDDDFGDVSRLADDETRIGALDSSRTEHSDLFSFDEFEPDVPVASAPGRRGTGDDEPARRVSSQSGSGVNVGAGTGAGRNLPVAVGVGIVLAVVALLLFNRGPGWTMLLVTPVIAVAAAEFFAAVRRGGYQPATLVGLVGSAALPLAVFWRGLDGFALVSALTVIAGLLWYLFAAPGERPVMNLAVTLFGYGWVGVLGSFAALLLHDNTNAIGLLLGAVVGTVAYDIGGLFVGRTSGHSQLAPSISPSKTYEGLAGGMILAFFTTAVVFAGVLSLYEGIAPWNGEWLHAIYLGLVVAIAAPLGDLCESMLKRDLGVKDMGTLLPGHGGVLDRFDAMLFVLPAVYYLARFLELTN